MRTQKAKEAKRMLKRLNKEFPYWLIRNFYKKIKGRQEHDKQKDQLHSKELKNAKPMTWKTCYENNRKKMLLRYENKIKSGKQPSKENEEWAPFVYYYRQRIIESHSRISAWRDFEYNVLEKMNNRNVEKPKDPYSLWSYVARQQINKLKRRGKSQPIKEGETEQSHQVLEVNWVKVIAAARQKIKRSQNRKTNNLTPTEEMWNLCYQVNLQKIHATKNHRSWSNCYYKNIERLKRRKNNKTG